MENSYLNSIKLDEHWASSSRWNGIKRPYTADDVVSLRNSVEIQYTLSKRGSEKLWRMLNNDKSFISALGATTGNQGVQMVKAGLKSIYLSGWQIAADANSQNTTYPDLSLYPSNSGPILAKKINNALLRAEQIERVEGNENTDYLIPLVADGESGFGGALNIFELTKHYIESGVAGINYEDQNSADKKCGHMGGKVIIPTKQHIKNLISARLASDVLNVPIVLIGRTDAFSALYLTNDTDKIDKNFITGERTEEGFYKISNGEDIAISRALSFAPYCDVLWCETPTPDLEFAKRFANSVHKEYPKKILAYNCSPSFDWNSELSKDEIASFQKELGEFGYKFQFISIAGFHSLNTAMFELAHNYKESQISAFAELQEKQKSLEKYGFTSNKHQREVGSEYYEKVSEILSKSAEYKT
tara:strand:+ start:364 stop:1611 length:1248 start_codon:yes stop_codon:yes gene_type:complete